jgi:hypothetical protein
MHVILKTTFFLFFICFTLQGQKYLFNNKQDSLFFTEFVNEFYLQEGTPLSFDGTLKFYQTNTAGKYFVEVLDTVSRVTGNLNIVTYINTPDGRQEKVFIDKFSFNIVKGPEPKLFVGKALSGERLDTSSLALSIGFINSFPKPNYSITEISLILNKKEVITVKSSGLTQSIIRKIKKLVMDAEIRITVAYQDPLLRS